MHASHKDIDDDKLLVSPRQVVLGLLFLAGFMIVLNWGINAIGDQVVRTAVQSAGALAPLAYIVAKASTYVLAPVSGGPFQILSGALFGLWQGTAYTLIADSLGASANFWLARRFGKPVIRKYVGHSGLRKVERVYNAVGDWRGLMMARLLLSAIYDFVSYAAGLTSVRFIVFLAVTVVAGVLPTMLFVAIGASLLLDRTLVLGAYIGLGLLSLIPLAIWRRSL